MPPNLARAIGEPQRTVQLRQGVVTATSSNGTCSVRLGGVGATAVAGVRSLGAASFAVGDSVFVLQQGYDLLILDRIKQASASGGFSALPIVAYEGVEIYQGSGVPMIDFHRAANPTGDSGADYNMRVVNAASGRLDVLGGIFRVDSGVGTNTEAVGAGAGYMFRERDGGGDWVLWADADVARIWRSGIGDMCLFRFSPNRIDVGGAQVGHGSFYGDFACFSHWTKFSAGNYALLQESNGTTYLNAASGTALYFRIANNNKMLIGNDSVEPKATVALYDNLIHTRAWNDDWHVMGWWSGNDGLRITEYGGLYYRVRDQDPHMRMEAYATTVFARFDQLGGWDTATLIVRSFGGGSPAMISWHAQGQNAAHLIKNWFSALECRSWDNGGWGIFRGELEDYSSIQSKKNVRRLAQKLDKAGRRQKQKTITAAHFNRKRGGCPNCVGTGLKRENRGVYAAAADPVKMQQLPVVVGLFGGTLDETPCPDCKGKGAQFMHPADEKNEEAGWFGFISEEVEKEFPEACYYRPSEADPSKIEVSGISVQALVAILWEDNKDQEDEIAALEVRIAKLEKKGDK